MTTCVHCERDEIAHSLQGACEIRRNGKQVGWHPVHRFTARSGEQVMSENIRKFKKRPVVIEALKLLMNPPISPATVQTGSRPTVLTHECATNHHDDCAGGSPFSTGMIPCRCDCHNETPPQPALPHNPPTGYCPHGYAFAANCGECFAERKRERDEGEKQAAPTAGVQYDAESRAVYARLSDRPVFETKELSANPIVTVDLDATGCPVGVEVILQPCPRCAELEQELAASRQDIIAASGELLIPIPLIGTRESKLLYANCLMRRDRDGLKARVGQLEKALRAALPFLQGCTSFGLVGSKKRDALVSEINSVIANAALAGGKA